MATYTASTLSGTANTIELTVAALEVALETIDTGKNHLTFGIEKIAGGRFAYWIAYTAEA